MEEISVITRKSGFQEDYKNFLASIGETPTVIIFTNDHNEIIYFEVVNNLVSQAEEDMRLALEEEMRLQAEQEKALADAMEKAAAEAAAAANQAKTETATEIAAQATSTPVAPAKSVSISAPNTGVKKADDGALALLTTFSGLLSVIFVVARKK